MNRNIFSTILIGVLIKLIGKSAKCSPGSFAIVIRQTYNYKVFIISVDHTA